MSTTPSPAIIDLTRSGLAPVDTVIRAAGSQAALKPFFSPELKTSFARPPLYSNNPFSSVSDSDKSTIEGNPEFAIRRAVSKLLDMGDYRAPLDLMVVADSRDDLIRAVLDAGKDHRGTQRRVAIADLCAAPPIKAARSNGLQIRRFGLPRHGRAGILLRDTLPEQKADVVYIESPDRVGHVEQSSDLHKGSETPLTSVDAAESDEQKINVLIVDQSESALSLGSERDVTDEVFAFQVDGPTKPLSRSASDVANLAVSLIDFGRFSAAESPPQVVVAVCDSLRTADSVRSHYEARRWNKAEALSDAAVFITGVTQRDALSNLHRVLRANLGLFNEHILKTTKRDALDRRLPVPLGLQSTGGVRGAMLGTTLALPVADFFAADSPYLEGRTQATLAGLLQECFARSGVKVGAEHSGDNYFLVVNALQDPSVFAEAVGRLSPLLNAPNGLYKALEQQPVATMKALKSGEFERELAVVGDLRIDDVSLVPTGYLSPGGTQDRIAIVDSNAIKRGKDLLGDLVHDRSEPAYLEAARRPLCDFLGLTDALDAQTVVVGGKRPLTSVMKSALQVSDNRVLPIEEWIWSEKAGSPSSRRRGRILKDGAVDVDAVIGAIRSLDKVVILDDPPILLGTSMSAADLLKLNAECKARGVLLVVNRSLDVGVIGYESRNKFVLDELVSAGSCALFVDTGPIVAPIERDTDKYRRMGICVFPNEQLARNAQAPKHTVVQGNSSHTFASLALIKAALEDKDAFLERTRSEMARHLPLLRRMGRVNSPLRMRGLSRFADYGSTLTRPAMHGADGQKRMLIVGGGIAGIAVGLEAIARGIPVTIVDDSPPGWDGKSRSNISVVAAAQFMPYINSTDKRLRENIARLVGLSRITFEVLASRPAKTGVLPIANVEMVPDSDRWAREIEQAMKTGRISLDQPLDALDLGVPTRFERYYEFDGFSINSAKTLQFLREAFVQAGGIIEHRTISPEESRAWDGPVVIAAGERAPDFDTTGAMGDGIYVRGGSIEYASEVPQSIRDMPAGISGGHMVMLPRIGDNGEFTWAVGGGAMKSSDLVTPPERDFDQLIADAKSMTPRKIGAWGGQGEQAFTNARGFKTARRTYNAPGIDMVRRDGNAVMVAGLEGTGWTLAFGLARDAVDMACGRQASLTTQALLV